MSAKQVFRSQISCDGCGTPHPDIGTDVFDARLRAAAAGWKHRSIRHAHSHWDRQVDLCPACVADDMTVTRVVLGSTERKVAGRPRS